MYNEKTELDVSNMDGLDESLLDSYSNLVGMKNEVDMGDLLRNESTKDLGDGFYLREGFRGGLYKKYIDGTIQRGFLIDGSGNVPLGETETVDLGNGKMMDRKKLIAYPKDKGFVKADGKGKFHYFEELSDLVKGEIARLNKLKDDAATAAADLKNAQNQSAAEQEAKRKQALEADRKFQLQKAESEQKAKEAEAKRVAAEKDAEVKIAEQRRLQGETEAQTRLRLAEEEAQTRLRLAETEAQSKEAEAKAKTKKAMIIGGSVLALVAGFFIYKKFGK
jgi:hypothetical protein